MEFYMNIDAAKLDEFFKLTAEVLTYVSGGGHDPAKINDYISEIKSWMYVNAPGYLEE